MIGLLAAGMRELGAPAERTTADLVARAGTDIEKNVDGLEKTVTYSGPVLVVAYAPFIQHSAAGGSAFMWITQDGTKIARAQSFAPDTSATGDAGFAFPGPSPWRRVVLSGSATFRVRIGSYYANGNAVIDALPDSPICLHVFKAA